MNQLKFESIDVVLAFPFFFFLFIVFILNPLSFQNLERLISTDFKLSSIRMYIYTVEGQIKKIYITTDYIFYRFPAMGRYMKTGLRFSFSHCDFSSVDRVLEYTSQHWPNLCPPKQIQFCPLISTYKIRCFQKEMIHFF